MRRADRISPSMLRSARRQFAGLARMLGIGWLMLLCASPAPVLAQEHTAARADCERLLNAVLPMAVELLRRHGEFYPYGGAIGRDGEVVTLAGHDTRDRPPAADLVATLKQGFIHGARTGEYIATALVQDVSVVLPSTGVGSDAVAVALDHRDQYSVVVVMPYERRGSDIHWGETYSLDGEADIFIGPLAAPRLQTRRALPLVSSAAP